MLKKRVFIALAIFFIIVIAAAFRYLQQGIPLLYEVLFRKDVIELRTEKKDDSFTILLLGRGGGKHDGPDLTDTIIFAQVDPKKNTVNMFSIPRDTWIPELRSKINEAYATGQSKGGKGMVLSKAVVEKVVGQRVDYVFVIDFSGFVQLVDFIGGIDVNIQRSFDDYAYPIEGKENDLCGHEEEEIEELATASSELEAFPCRYKHISFQQGVQHMDGTTALEFVRSRHAMGPEGSDFARGRRQQAVISAFREKVFSLGILLNPVKVIGMYNIVKDHIDTTIVQDEYDDFIKIAQKMQSPTIKNHVLGEADETQNMFGLLMNPEETSEEYRYQWVLIPRVGNGDFSEIGEYVTCIEAGNICEISETDIIINPQKESNPKE